MVFVLARKLSCIEWAPFWHLSFRESCLFHILPPMPTSLHWWDWKKPQESLQRTSANNTPGFPVAQHFNSTGHSISDVQVRGVALCSGTNIQRKATWDAVDFSNRHRSAERTEYQFQFHLNWDVIYILRVQLRVRVLLSFLWCLRYCVVLYNGFFSHWKRVINPKRLCFLKTFDTFRFFFTGYHLISCYAICSLHRPMRMRKREGEG